MTNKVSCVKEYGKVKWFGGYNRNTGKENDYGFIETSDGTAYHVHKKAITCGNSLQEGQWVEFTPRERLLENGQTKHNAQQVKGITPHPSFPFAELLSSEEAELTQFLLYEAIKQAEQLQLASQWFQQCLNLQSSKDEECKNTYFINPYRRYDPNFQKNLAEIIKGIRWRDYPSRWGLTFYKNIVDFNIEEANKLHIQYVDEWLEQQTIEFLLQHFTKLPKWLQDWGRLLQIIQNWLSQTSISEHIHVKEWIPNHVKEKLNLWYLSDVETFHASFAKYWTSIEKDDVLQEECLEHWLYFFRSYSFAVGWEMSITGKHLEWSLKRQTYKKPTPLNWSVNTLYVQFPSIGQPVKVKVPISKIWEGLPASFFKFLATKLQKKELSITIPLEAWALYLSQSQPTEKAIYWIKSQWKDMPLAQKLTIFSLLGEKWFHTYQLHTDLGSTEALLLWEDMPNIDLSQKGLWWNQLDILGKCSWYILAFQKGYKNTTFLEEHEHPLLQSFQLLYKHYIGIQKLPFMQWHSLLQDYYIDLAKHFDGKSLKSSTWLWPACDYKECTYCEGKPWKQGNEQLHEISRAYCPRTKKECSLATKEQETGARFRSYIKPPAHWSHWRMPEILSYLQITVPPEIEQHPGQYVIRFSSWLNRLLELQERLKCRGCHEPMINDFHYSKDFTARYAMTIATCHQTSASPHDKEIYFNDCWNRHDCHQMIDSRDNKVQDMKDRTINPNLGTFRNYYLCLECGAAKSPSLYPGHLGWPQHRQPWDLDKIYNHFARWYYVPGDVCPMCGSEDMKRFAKSQGQENTHAQCNSCSHTIRIPKVFLPVIAMWEHYKNVR